MAEKNDTMVSVRKYTSRFSKAMRMCGPSTGGRFGRNKLRGMNIVSLPSSILPFSIPIYMFPLRHILTKTQTNSLLLPTFAGKQLASRVSVTTSWSRSENLPTRKPSPPRLASWTLTAYHPAACHLRSLPGPWAAQCRQIQSSSLEARGQKKKRSLGCSLGSTERQGMTEPEKAWWNHDLGYYTFDPNFSFVLFHLSNMNGRQWRWAQG